MTKTIHEITGHKSKDDATKTLTAMLAVTPGATGRVIQQGANWTIEFSPDGADLESLSATGQFPSGGNIAWGGVTLAKHGRPFNDRVIDIANKLSCDPNHLMAVMAFETGKEFTPDVQNKTSGATGLIQFMPSTAVNLLGTTTAKLAKMKALDQLSFVETYFMKQSSGRKLSTLSDVYMCVLWPAAIGKPESHVLFSAPSKAYDMNKGLDVNKDDKVTKAEAASKVATALTLGMATVNIG